MQNPTATQIAYYHLCHRKLWLFSKGMGMEVHSALVAEGKLIHETTYRKRSEHLTEIQVGNIKIDHFNTQTRMIHETKKSAKMEQAHVAQLQYYIYRLREAGISVSGGVLEYPKLRQREEVFLSTEQELEIPKWVQGVQHILEQEDCPPRLERSSLCKRCAYYEFCFV